MNPVARSVMQFISSGGFYGAERILVELAAYLRQTGWDPHVVALESPGAASILAEAQRLGLRTQLLPGARAQPWKSVTAIRRYVIENAIRLVHTHGYKTDVYAALAGLPRSVRKVATVHNWDSRTWALRLYERIDKIALRAFDHVVLVSPQLHEEVRRLGLSARRTSMIENGVALEETEGGDRAQQLRQELGVRPGERLILRVGRLVPIKGNDVLIEAVAALASRLPTLLVFVGEGEEREGLAALARKTGLDRVVFAGYRRDMTALLRAADLFVISSQDEGLPVVLLEAMAAGVPVVSTAVGAIPRVIEPGRNGWLVPPADSHALAAAVSEALEQPERAREMGRQARVDYQRFHSREAMGRRYVELYEGLLREEPRLAPTGAAEGPQARLGRRLAQDP